MLQPKAKKKNTSPLFINIFNIIWREVKDDIFPASTVKTWIELMS